VCSISEHDIGNFSFMVLKALAPEYPFPTQLRQATAAVQHLLDKGTPPSHIILAGDSAGGNLVLQLASLILHPHPTLPLPPTPRLSGADASAASESEQPLFGGLLLILPWVEFDTNVPSCVRNAARDIAPTSMYQLFADAVKPGVSPALHFHFEPGLAPSGWWSGLGRIFPRVLVTGGEHEGLIDPILTTAAAISEEVQDTTVFVLPGGVHEDLIRRVKVGEGMTISW